jgi:YegS/Rv2252/BmrU family lipid kinase
VPPFDHVIVIANPTSGSGRAANRLRAVVCGLQALGAPVDSVVTQAPGDARDAAQKASGDAPLLVAFGGDGTFNEVLNGAPLERAVLGLVPAGTGNVLAKELGLSLKPHRAAAQLVEGDTVRYDIGECNARLFACMFGAGFDARVVQLVDEGRGNSMSKLRYVPYVAKALWHMPRWDIRVEVDGQTLATGMRQVIVANTRSYGGPVQMAPAAGPNDGCLDAAALPMRGAIGCAGAACQALLRRVHKAGSAAYGRGSEFTVTADADDVPVQIDGEPAGSLPASITVHPGAARLLAPAGYSPVPPLPLNDRQ